MIEGTSGIGTSGSSGSSGINGTSGTSGTSGISGTSGSSGINGTSGSSGTSGINGTSGTSGTSGSSGIKARAYRNAAQDIDAGPTKILIDTISFDAEDVVDITNSRITPNLPGYYVVMGNVISSNMPERERISAMIYKNGVLVTYGTTVNHGKSVQNVVSSSTASDLIYMNGTTDYLELYAYNSDSTALTLDTGYSYQNYISVLGPF